MPRSWAELSPLELEQVYRIMATVTTDALLLAVFRKLAGIRIVREMPDGGFLCVAGDRDFILTPEQMLAVYDELEWLSTPGNTPVRLDNMRGCSAVDAQLHGVKFGDYLALENSYQGYLHSRQEKALRGAAAILYPGLAITKPLCDLERFVILQWLVQLKNMFAGIFVNLFKVDGGEGDVSPLEIMNNEIRALTGGDVTKESIVLDTDCWRALTELDFKAKEAEDFKASIPKK